MNHPYREETRTPEEVRLSKKAYKKRKVLAKKKRVKSEKLKRKKENRLRLKEANAVESRIEPVAEADSAADETDKAEIEESADGDRNIATGVGPGEEGVLKDAGHNTEETSEDPKKTKKKGKKRKRSAGAVVAEPTNCEGNVDADGKQDPDSTGMKTSRIRKLDGNKRRKSEKPDECPKEGDDGAEGTEGRDRNPLDQEDYPSTETDEGSKTVAEELPPQPDVSVEARKKKTLDETHSNSSGQRDKLVNTNDEDANRDEANRKKAYETKDANNSESGTVADIADDLNSDETKGDKVDPVSNGADVREKRIEKKGKKDIRLKKKRSKRKGEKSM